MNGRLEEALEQVAIADAPALGRRHARVASEAGSGNGSGTRELHGLLEVLPAGPIPPDLRECVSSSVLGKVLRALRERADILLFDAPPVSHIGDAGALSTRVGGIVLVPRSKALRRQTLAELTRRLTTVPAPVLGFVVTGEGEGDGAGLTSYGYHPRASEAVEPSSGARQA